MNIRYTNFLIIVLVAHILLLYIFSKDKQEESIVNIKVSNGSGNIKLQQDDASRIWVGYGDTLCKHYDGLGFQYELITAVVTYVAPGSPADRAGLKKKDILVTPLWHMKLVFDQVVDVRVKRDNSIIDLTMKVERICEE